MKIWLVVEYDGVEGVYAFSTREAAVAFNQPSEDVCELGMLMEAEVDNPGPGVMYSQKIKGRRVPTIPVAVGWKTGL